MAGIGNIGTFGMTASQFKSAMINTSGFAAQGTGTAKQFNNKMEELIYTLKKQIIEALNLEEVTPEDMKDNIPLFGGGFGLDSIDVLELIVLLEKNYGIELQSPAEAKEIFTSVRTMAEYVMQNRKK